MLNMTRREMRRSYWASGEGLFVARLVKVICPALIAFAIATSGTAIAQERIDRSENAIGRPGDRIIEHGLRSPIDGLFDAYNNQTFLGLGSDDLVYWQILRNRELPQ